MGARMLIALGVALVLLLLWRSVFVVDESEVALATRFGQVHGAPYGPGLHLKSPLDEVHVFDRRILTRAYPGESFLTRDQKALSVDFYVKWQLLDAARFMQASGGDADMAGLRLADIVRDKLKSAVAGQPLSKVLADARGHRRSRQGIRPQVDRPAAAAHRSARRRGHRRVPAHAAEPDCPGTAAARQRHGGRREDPGRCRAQARRCSG
jgi:HflC protein